MSIHSDILDAAREIIGESADVRVDQEHARATELRAISKQTGFTDTKTVVHGLGYLTETRTWAKSFLERITI